MLSFEQLWILAKSRKTEIGENYEKYHFPYTKLSTPFKRLKRHEINALMLLTVEKSVDLCRLLKTPFLPLQDIMNNPGYKKFQIGKKAGGERQICAPEQRLKTIQKRLNYFLQAYYLCIKPKEVHGFVVNPHYLKKACNVVENAKPHVKKKHVFNVDLEDFFPSISAKRIKETFASPYFDFSDQIIHALTLLTTFEGKLPIGAPTSPVVSNFVCLALDKDLIGFCESNNLVYTRYADDLTFSSETKIDRKLSLDLIHLILKNNFAINENKLRMRYANSKQTVTGLTVNEKVNVDRKLLKKIRAMLHDLSTNGIEQATQRHFKLTGSVDESHCATFINKLEGYINFVGQVRGKKDSLYGSFKLDLSILKVYH